MVSIPEAELRRLRASVRHYEDMFASHGDALFVADAETGRILDANPAARALLGRSRDELRAMHRADLHPPELRAEVQGQVRAIDAVPETCDIVRTLVRHADGRDIPVEIRASGSVEVEGRRLVTCLFRDLTERTRIDEALRISEERYRLSMEATDDGLWDWDVARDVVHYSPGYHRMLGRDPVDEVGRFGYWLDRLHPDDRDGTVEANVACVAGTIESFEQEFRMRADDGSWRWILGRGKCVARDADGRALRLVGTHVDITRRKAVEQELAAARDDLERRVVERTAALEEEIATRRRAEAELQRARGTLEASVVARTAALAATNDRLRREMAERAQAEAALQAQSAELLASQEAARVGTWTFDVDERVFRGSPFLFELIGRPDRERLTVDAWLAMVHPDDRPAFRGHLRLLVAHGGRIDEEFRLLSAGTEEPMWIRASGTVERDGSGRAWVRGTLMDVTERKRADRDSESLREQLHQSQRVEAIGRLAGGVAHDFNNMLNVILGYGEVALGALREGDPVRGHVAEMVEAGRRSAALTRQLLAFSRKQALAPEVVDVHAMVEGLEGMLRRVVGEDVDLTLASGSEVGRVLVDPRQLEQVVMNLVVNARDAMPRGGSLRIETSCVPVDEAVAARMAGMVPGTYVRLTVEDSGCGMDEAVLAQVFEPFFTTKGVGRGTGLGLSMVYGVVKQSGGFVYASSRVEEGSRFEVYLPRVEAPVADGARAPVVGDVGGRETVLVVEDEVAVRRLVGTLLGGVGYRVLLAEDGAGALGVLAGERGGVDLLLTDVVMSGIDGMELARRALEAWPGLRVLFMSGYSDDVLNERGGGGGFGGRFLGKPFAGPILLRKVREALDAEAPTDAALLI